MDLPFQVDGEGRNHAGPGHEELGMTESLSGIEQFQDAFVAAAAGQGNLHLARSQHIQM